MKFVFRCVLAGFVLLNVVAANHAWKMSHYRSGGIRTKAPEQLSLLEKARVLTLGVSLPRPTDISQPDRYGLAADSLFLTAEDGKKLGAWHLPHPQARGTAVLFHGYTICKSYLLPEAAFLWKQGYACLLVDFRGHGESDAAAVTLGMHEARDVQAGVDWMKHRYPELPLLAYGRSMGSAAILNAVHQQRIQPARIILECPFASSMDSLRSRFRAMKMPAFPFANLLCFWSGALNGYNAFRLVPENFARSVRCPTLVLHGEQDPRSSVEEVQRIVDNIPGPAAFTTFPESGHESYLVTMPDRYRTTVTDWLNR